MDFLFQHHFLKKLLLLTVLTMVCGTISAQSYQPGEVYFSDHDYIEYRAGNMPLIIAVPHGGYENPESIPDRTCNSPVYVRDAYTLELGQLIDSVFEIQYGCRPHMIINHLDRRKLDANRNFEDAACGNTEAEHAWQAFHYFIDEAKSIVEQDFDRGLFIDLHGHGHWNQRLELGYMLLGTTLAFSDNQLNQPAIVNYSSIKKLVGDNLNSYTHSELLRGDFSFGAMMKNRQYASVPSPQDPHPSFGELYFSGGYNTKIHGSSDGGKIDGIQLECNMTGVRDSHENRQAFAGALTEGLVQYLEVHYFGNDNFIQCATSTTEISKPELSNILTYPNPSAGFVNIQLDEQLDLNNTNLVIYDLKAAVIYQRPLEDHRFMLNLHGKISPGKYLLVIEHPQKTFRQPIIVLD
ncbi:MAG: T9SS C-terminal target domain-containing protein [Chitinophagaceae bacterium]|nr:MAG: T9SS C-terminal target domain-containing protein [Chitinophagaceae bacterium]